MYMMRGRGTTPFSSSHHYVVLGLKHSALGDRGSDGWVKREERRRRADRAELCHIWGRANDNRGWRRTCVEVCGRVDAASAAVGSAGMGRGPINVRRRTRACGRVTEACRCQEKEEELPFHGKGAWVLRLPLQLVAVDCRCRPRRRRRYKTHLFPLVLHLLRRVSALDRPSVADKNRSIAPRSFPPHPRMPATQHASSNGHLSAVSASGSPSGSAPRTKQVRVRSPGANGTGDSTDNGGSDARPPPKRARKAINCEPCRNSKLKCDRCVSADAVRSSFRRRVAPPSAGPPSSEIRLANFHLLAVLGSAGTAPARRACLEVCLSRSLSATSTDAFLFCSHAGTTALCYQGQEADPAFRGAVDQQYVSFDPLFPSLFSPI